MSLLSFQEISKNIFFDFNVVIQDIENYLAHLSSNDLEKEPLLTHSNLVLKYAIKLMNDNKIEANINTIIQVTTDNAQIQNDMKVFYLKAIYWHDIGKINENFQKDKMNNTFFKNIENSISSKHSILSAYLYLVSCFQYINQNYKDTNEKIELISICVYFSLTLWRHHTGLYSSWKEFLNGSEGTKICTNLYSYVLKLNIKIDKQMHEVLIEYLRNMHFVKNENYYLLSKSLFSLLIISDYYATAQFMNYGNIDEFAYNDFGLIKEEFSDKVYCEFYSDKFDKNGNQQTFNQALKDIKSIDSNFENLEEKSNKNLNILRNKLFLETRENLKANITKNLFYIEAPTGAGKTNLSLMSTVEILKHDSSINKIFYVFPFTTLITQTYDAIKNSLNLKNSEIVQLHSKAKYNEKDESKKDGVYGDEKTNFLDNQFMNYPLTLLSHVKFFNILTGVSKDDNYIFHRLANSIVIIDEIQTYSPNLWSSIVYLLDSIAHKFNIKFIVMSATLPKIGDILNEPNNIFTPLVSNKQEYFSNPNFGKRVIIESKPIKIKKSEEIYKKLLTESENYQKLESNKTNVVRTIIEFITKKGADEFYKEAIKENKKFFDEIFLLSGTILEPRRQDIINFLKNRHDKNILLVTTQVVEAGVDIDMDIGFKEKSLIDSDEQLAGRINRNSSKEGNKLFLFEMKNAKAKFVYKGDKRLKVHVNEDVLQTKNFDIYYEQVIKEIKKLNDTPFIEGLNSYIDHIKNLRFNEAHIKIIDMESLSIFVPLNDEAIKIWAEYGKTIKSQDLNFTERQIKLQTLASDISKYTFSLADYKNSGLHYLKKNGYEEYGYLYLENWNTVSDGKKLYSYKDGLETSVLSGEFVAMIL